jgi:hypothetical protein
VPPKEEAENYLHSIKNQVGIEVHLVPDVTVAVEGDLNLLLG